MFKQFNSEINGEVASFLFRGMIPIQREEVHSAREEKTDNSNLQTNIDAQKEAEEAQRRAAMQQRGEQIEKPKTFKRTEKKVGRNDPCPCGSGKKYKNCCGR